MADHSSGPWKYAPRRCEARYTSIDWLALIVTIGFVLAALMASAYAARGMEKTAYDAVHFQSCFRAGC